MLTNTRSVAHPVCTETEVPECTEDVAAPFNTHTPTTPLPASSDFEQDPIGPLFGGTTAVESASQGFFHFHVDKYFVCVCVDRIFKKEVLNNIHICVNSSSETADCVASKI